MSYARNAGSTHDKTTTETDREDCGLKLFYLLINRQVLALLQDTLKDVCLEQRM
jgi:hypothetical protein